MARNNDRDRGQRVQKDTRPRGKMKVCIFCTSHVEWVDYKDVNLLRRFMSDRGKIKARRISGNCAQHQREVATAIKTARELALLPYTQRTVSERGPAGGAGGGSRPGGPREQAVEPDEELVLDLGADGGLELDERDEAVEPDAVRVGV
jgi:small subunit ribosomal protein S18